VGWDTEKPEDNCVKVALQGHIRYKAVGMSVWIEVNETNAIIAKKTASHRISAAWEECAKR